MRKTLIVILLFCNLIGYAQPAPKELPTAQGRQVPPTEVVLITLYSAGKYSKLPFGGGPGVQPWGSHLWVDNHKITVIRKGYFLTLRLPEGEHALAGENGLGHESRGKIIISLQRRSRYFIRLTSKSSGAPYAPMHYFAEPVTCQEAYDDGAVAMEPIRMKHVEKSSLDYVVRESYFPECPKVN